MQRAGTIRVEIVYAMTDRQRIVTVLVPPGTSIDEAVRSSGLIEQHPEILLHTRAVGIHGRVMSTGATVANGDRIEIYRPLTADPKQTRRQRAERQLRKRRT